MGKLALLSACICPVVGTGVIVHHVPRLREAVHHWTAPPVTHAARPAAAVPCTPVAPVANAMPLPEVPAIPMQMDAPVPALAGGVPLVSSPGVPVFTPGSTGDLPFPVVPVNPPVVTPPQATVPEISTWAGMMLGFAYMGGMIRSQRGRLAQRRAALDRVIHGRA